MTMINLTNIKFWMLENDALEVTINTKDNVVLAYMHKTNVDYQTFIKEWLEGNISSEDLEKFLEDRYWLVQYFYDDFLEVIENE